MEVRGERANYLVRSFTPLLLLNHTTFLSLLGYYHELFLKGRPGLVVNLKRTKVKGTFKKKRDPGSEPKYVYLKASLPLCIYLLLENIISPLCTFSSF